MTDKTTLHRPQRPVRSRPPAQKKDSSHVETPSSSQAMTSVVERPVIRLRMPDGWARSLLSGVEAAFLGWALCTVASIFAYWTTSENPWMGSVTWENAYHAGSDGWALILGGTLHIANVSYRALPTLGGIFLVCVLRLFLRSSRHFPRAASWFAVPGFAIPSLLFVGLIAPHARWVTALPGALLIPLVAVAWALLRRFDWDTIFSRFPTWVKSGITWGIIEVIGLIVVSALAVITAILMSRERIAGIHQLLLTTSWQENTLVIGAQALFLPSLCAWALAWLAGPGFWVGTDAWHSVTSAPSGAIPGFPVLGAIPQTTPGHGICLLLVLVGILLGALVVWRSAQSTLKTHMYATGIATIVLAVAVWPWIASSTLVLGAHRMAFLGPHAAITCLLVVLEVGGGFALAGLVGHQTSRAFVQRQWEISKLPRGVAASSSPLMNEDEPASAHDGTHNETAGDADTDAPPRDADNADAENDTAGETLADQAAHDSREKDHSERNDEDSDEDSADRTPTENVRTQTADIP
ncbi:DUF6350 family protein [Schaalia sp. ZJ1691]|uniref:cell division protein PerM n=1 Tax=Schaalia sp. ZJ1691 TaxID=2709404 RepID=UPI0013ED15B0|nr:DUF6350 family protein [Schaalia sp. ZJ1691]